MPAPLTGLYTSATVDPDRPYAVSNHPMASPAQLALTDSQYEVHYRLAVALLGLDGVQLTGRDVQAAATAVTLQINWQLAHDTVSWILQAESRGERAWTFRDAVPMVDPRAQALVTRLVGAAGWYTVRTTRPLRLRPDPTPGELAAVLGATWYQAAREG